MGIGKKIAFLSLGLVVSLVIADILSAYGLFFYQNAFVVRKIWEPGHERSIVYSEGITPAVSVINTVVERIKAKLKARKEANVQPPEAPPYKVLFTRNAEFGWVATPGSYEFVFSHPPDTLQEWPRSHTWHATILSDGSRATSRRPMKCNRKILIFGDSWIFGWALNEELTMAWHVQSEYKGHYCVSLLAHGGYGHLQTLQNFRKRRSEIGKDDILLVGYAQWLLPRNLPSPSVVRSLSEGLKHYADGPDKPLMHPRATLSGDRLLIDTIPLDCQAMREYCERKEPTLDDLFDVTNKIFDEIIDHAGARLLVLLLDGPEDKVVEHLRHRGVTVVDGRPPEGIYAKDTMNPYDAHPGPISNRYWFAQLRKEIDKLL